MHVERMYGIRSDPHNSTCCATCSVDPREMPNDSTTMVLVGESSCFEVVTDGKLDGGGRADG